LASIMPLRHDAAELMERADRLRDAFNDAFWDDRGWFAMGLDGNGRQIDSLTTNPGQALWSGVARPDLAHRYFDTLMQPTMWTGWGFRTLAENMGAYDPLSYHNGSVWPHDTAICAAAAAVYGRWDVVDRVVDGALDAALEFDGRPPELFAGIARSEAPMPVIYPSSCSPQAWSSASVLLLVRTMLGLAPMGPRRSPGGAPGSLRSPGCDAAPTEGEWSNRGRRAVQRTMPGAEGRLSTTRTSGSDRRPDVAHHHGAAPDWPTVHGRDVVWYPSAPPSCARCVGEPVCLGVSRPGKLMVAAGPVGCRVGGRGLTTASAMERSEAGLVGSGVGAELIEGVVEADATFAGEETFGLLDHDSPIEGGLSYSARRCA